MLKELNNKIYGIRSLLWVFNVIQLVYGIKKLLYIKKKDCLWTFLLSVFIVNLGLKILYNLIYNTSISFKDL